ncbi:hypothetical protein GEV29_14645 [Aeromicrobium sp. SMF47]|uniref:hypothetical protein n=1 Tax=Aeromicrobium TaxID=2040 RepID=UPI00129D6E7E|nr:MULTISPECIES: hypothetical protein [Aeromicrobium]MRJ77780.1 hypothetical protein [Aeromicrobium yanjiei]MRK02149.1 hypothetical protein [Aeromicrobium sp. S22]
MTDLQRRTLLLGSAGLLLAGCGGGKDGSKTKPTATPTGPNIVKPRTGNVVTEADTAALRDRLNQAFRTGDVNRLKAVIDPGDYGLKDFEKRWRRRFDNFERLGFVEGEWYVGVPNGRTRNASGGLVEYTGDLVFAHTVMGCDGQQVVETTRAGFRKKTADAPLELMSVGDVEESYDPSIWDVAEVDAIETKHAWIVFRLQDRKRARAYAAQIETGAARAFATMPRPRGVDKVLYALTWPAVDGKLYGGVGISDADAHAYYHPFVDPDELARGQKKPVKDNGLPRGTGRVGLHEASFSRSDFTAVACHEAVHVLAEQWSGPGDTPTWAVEGLAMWAAEGGARLMAREGASIRSTFAEFERVALKGYEEFHETPREREFYACAGAVYASIEDEKGRDAVFKTAETFYASSREEAADTLGRSEPEIFAATRTWLGL